MNYVKEKDTIRKLLEVKYKGKNISEVLDMTKDAYEFFERIPSLRRKLQTLIDVGMEYIKFRTTSHLIRVGRLKELK